MRKKNLIKSSRINVIAEIASFPHDKYTSHVELCKKQVYGRKEKTIEPERKWFLYRNKMKKKKKKKEKCKEMKRKHDKCNVTMFHSGEYVMLICTFKTCIYECINIILTI